MFVNEYITPEEYEKRHLHDVDARFVVGNITSRSWTIDKEKDIYLRQLTRGREEFVSKSEWALWWKGEFVFLKLAIVDAKGIRGGHGWTKRKLEAIAIPLHLESQKGEIIREIRAALDAYKDAGVYSSTTSHISELEV